MALAHEQKGQLGKAIPAMEKCYELDKQPEALAQLGHMYAAAGRIADAERVLGTLQRVAETRYVSAYSMGLVYAGLRRADEAFEWFERVEQDRSEWFAFIAIDPRLEWLHPDPRFARLVRAVGLDPGRYGIRTQPVGRR